MFGGAKTRQWACAPRHIVSVQGPRPGLTVCWSYFEFLIISEQETPCFLFAQRLRLITNSITHPWFLRHLTVPGSNESPAPALTYKFKNSPNCTELCSFVCTWIILSSLSCSCWGPKWENGGESNKSLSPVFLLKPWRTHCPPLGLVAYHWADHTVFVPTSGHPTHPLSSSGKLPESLLQPCW